MDGPAHFLFFVFSFVYLVISHIPSPHLVGCRSVGGLSQLSAAVMHCARLRYARPRWMHASHFLQCSRRCSCSCVCARTTARHKSAWLLLLLFCMELLKLVWFTDILQTFHFPTRPPGGVPTLSTSQLQFLPPAQLTSLPNQPPEPLIQQSLIPLRGRAIAIR